MLIKVRYKDILSCLEEIALIDKVGIFLPLFILILITLFKLLVNNKCFHLFTVNLYLNIKKILHNKNTNIHGSYKVLSLKAKSSRKLHVSFSKQIYKYSKYCDQWIYLFQSLLHENINDTKMDH